MTSSKQWLDQTKRQLQEARIDSAHLDTLILLEDVTGRDRSWLLAHPEVFLEDLLQIHIRNKLEGMIKRRVQHEPLAYIREKAEFYSREFYVNKYVMVPRPETETIIELLKKLVDSRPIAHGSPLQSTIYGLPALIDIGTGSGALAITGKLEFPEIEVIATDVDSDCLKVAIKNARKLGAKIKFFEGNLLEALSILHFPSSFIILANLPYIPENFPINHAASREPKLALYGGQDGLDLYRELFNQAAQIDHSPQYILTEALPSQHKELARIAKICGYNLEQAQDFIQVFAPNTIP